MSTPSDLSSASIFNVAGSVALVTGGGTGIGLMIATGLANNGAKVYIAGRRKDVVEKVAAQYNFQGSNLNGKLIPMEIDVTNKDSIKRAVSILEAADGKLDILINNAGQVGPRTPFFSDNEAPQNETAMSTGNSLFEAESFEGWADLFTINVSSVFFTSMAFLGLLERATRRTGGHSASIVNVGSISGLMKQSQNHFAYNASKAAVHHLTKMLATELALKGHSIRVNAIAPGPFPSEMAGSGTKHIDDEVDEIAMGLTAVPAKRAGRDIDAVAAVLYLTSPAGYYVNGQVLSIDGGFLAVNPSTA